MLVQDKYDTLEILIKALQKSHENITICQISCDQSLQLIVIHVKFVLILKEIKTKFV